MDIIFKVTDKTGRIIYLLKERFKHILNHHSYMFDQIYNIQITLQRPLKIIDNEFDKNVKYYYKYFKERKQNERYLFVGVKYLNHKGYIITSYYTDKIK